MSNDELNKKVGNILANATGFLNEKSIDHKSLFQIPLLGNPSEFRDVVITRVYNKDGIAESIKFNAKTTFEKHDLEFLAQNFDQLLGKSNG